PFDTPSGARHNRKRQQADIDDVIESFSSLLTRNFPRPETPDMDRLAEIKPSEELRQMFKEIATAQSEAAMQTRRDGQASQQSRGPDANAVDLARERDAQLAAALNVARDRLKSMVAERNKIKTGTWVAPEMDLNEPHIVVSILPTLPDTSDAPASHAYEFDPNILPKLEYGKNIFHWIKAMKIMVNIYGEQRVCSSVFPYCLVEGYAVYYWFLYLGDTDIEYMISRPGCWEFMKRRMTARWGISLGLFQDECDRRLKRVDESYTVYAYEKLHLIEGAYLGFNEDNKVLKIRAGLDPSASQYCREYKSLDRLTDECM
ncbi:hypothetical protein BZA05DRAFT_453165, partial [Tricharina praecox]|uniref:uncharacterized protein n=1 Tax=Tricharina praecox TaxID=43433 RepID=UPI002220F84B